MMSEETAVPSASSSKEVETVGRGGRRSLHLGLLILRVGVGLVFIGHGFPKLKGGPEVWTKIGKAMALVGLGFAPVFWGFMAAVSEALGGLLLALGVLVRPAAVLMLVTMTVAVVFLANGDAGFSQWSHPLTVALVFLGFAIMGGGRYALGSRIPGFRGRLWQ